MQTTRSKLLKYKFVEEVPKDIVQVPGFPEGDFAKDFLKEFQGRARTDYHNARELQVFNLCDGVLKGSNDYSVVLANQILRQVNLRTATHADIERVLEEGKLSLEGFYVDTALCLRSAEEPNEYLAKDLARQIGDRKMPVMIPLANLELRVDENSLSGLAFNLVKDAEIIYAPELSWKYNRKSFQKANKKGLPILGQGGNRILYTRDSGLSRVCLDAGSVLNSFIVDLAFSNDYGRVVLVSAEGANIKIPGGKK